MGFFDGVLGRKATPASQALPAFHPAGSAEAFTEMLAAEGLSVDSLDVSSALDQAVVFYRDQRCDRCDPEADGDMLLYEWGVFDWGNGPSFQFGLTRQFTIDDALGDEGMSQLSLALHFTPAPSLAALGTGSQWCTSPAELNDFERDVRASAPFIALAEAVPNRVELEWGGV